MNRKYCCMSTPVQTASSSSATWDGLVPCVMAGISQPKSGIAQHTIMMARRASHSTRCCHALDTCSHKNRHCPTAAPGVQNQVHKHNAYTSMQRQPWHSCDTLPPRWSWVHDPAVLTHLYENRKVCTGGRGGLRAWGRSPPASTKVGPRAPASSFAPRSELEELDGQAWVGGGTCRGEIRRGHR